MDLAGRWDFIIEQGSTFERYFRWEDSNGNPRALDAYTLRMRIRYTPDLTTVLATTEGESPTIVISQPGATGVFKIAMTATNTALLDFIRAVYDVEAYEGVVVYRIVEGNVTLSKEVTYTNP